MKPRNQNIDEGTIKAILEAERTGALGAIHASDLSEQRTKALDYYMGDMSATMPASEGQSSAVSSDVQDVVEGLIPIVLDALTGNDNVVEFAPQAADDVAAAKQETDYVNHVFYQQNPGFLILHTAIKDGCLQKNCFVKWWMEKDEARTREDYKGLTEDSYALITADEAVTVVDSEQYTDVDPITQQPGIYYNVTVEEVSSRLRPRVAAVPPEEILVSKLARDIPNAPYLAHVRGRPMVDVIADYPDKEQVIRTAPTRSLTADNAEALERQTVQDNSDAFATADAVNKDMREIEVAEHYTRLALEDDKIARRYKITTVGPGYNILDIEEVASWPFASGTPIPMPHRLFGRSVADLVLDVQEIKTSLLRATLNSAYFANNQRIEVSETHASENTIDDLLNNRVGGIVRTRMPGGLNTIENQSIGGWIGGVIEYMDGVRDARTGVSRSTTGLEPDSLNHSRPGAVNRLMDAAEMRVKMIARIYAETLIVDMFRGIHEMLQQFSEQQNVAYLAGSWVPVNPREWRTRKDMKVTLPLGGASKQQLVGFLSQILGVQKEAMISQGGPNGPLVSWEGVFNTLDQMTQMAGLRGAEPFFMKPAPPNPNTPAPPDPKMVEAQAKARATQADQQAKAQIAQQQFAHETQMEQLKLQAQRQRDQEEFVHKQQLDRMKFEHDAEMEQLKLGHDLRLAAFKAHEDAKLNAQQAALQAKPGVGSV